MTRMCSPPNGKGLPISLPDLFLPFPVSMPSSVSPFSSPLSLYPASLPVFYSSPMITENSIPHTPFCPSIRICLYRCIYKNFIPSFIYSLILHLVFPFQCKNEYGNFIFLLWRTTHLEKIIILKWFQRVGAPKEQPTLPGTQGRCPEGGDPWGGLKWMRRICQREGRAAGKPCCKARVFQGPGVFRARRSTECLGNEGLAFQVEELGFILCVVGIPQRL